MAGKLHSSAPFDTEHHGKQTAYFFYCPGCNHVHAFHHPRWTWNGSLDKPTVSPSINCNPSEPKRRCHFFIRNGRIEYCRDSYHQLAGLTVDLPDWDDNFF